MLHSVPFSLLQNEHIHLHWLLRESKGMRSQVLLPRLSELNPALYPIDSCCGGLCCDFSLLYYFLLNQYTQPMHTEQLPPMLIPINLAVGIL